MRCDPLTRGWGFVGVAAHTLGTGEAQRLWGAGTEGQQAEVSVLVSGGTVTSAGGFTPSPERCQAPTSAIILAQISCLKPELGLSL